MQICFVMQSASRLAYGLFPVVVGTAHALTGLGHNARVVAGKDDRSADDLEEWGKIPVTSLNVLPPRNLHYVPGLGRWFRRQSSPDVISLHGVWMAMHATAFRFARERRIPVLMTPHGSLDPWALALSRTKKRIARLLYVDRVLHGVDCFHALNGDEALAFRRAGMRAPIAIVPNGVDPLRTPVARHYGGLRTLLFMGRIHTKKGIQELIKAWTLVGPDHPDWELVVAGPDELGLRSELEHQSTGHRVRFIGEVRGEEKASVLRSSHAFILPSFSEGLPMSILEAWSYGLPVVMSRECNLPQGFSQGAAIEVRPDVPAIVSSLRTVFSLTADELVAIGDRGRQLTSHQYSWDHVAQELVKVYQWLLRLADRPSSVHLD